MIDSQTHPRWADSQRNFSEHLRSVRTLNTCLTNLLKVTFHRWFSMVVCFFRPLPGVFTHWDQIPWEAEEWWPGLRTHHRPIHSKPPLKFHELIPPPKKKHPPSEKSRRYKKKSIWPIIFGICHPGGLVGPKGFSPPKKVRDEICDIENPLSFLIKIDQHWWIFHGYLSLPSV